MTASRNRSSRKRPQAFIGVGLAAAAVPLLSSLVVMVEASPFYQHRVRASKRKVSYRHTIEKLPREVPAKFLFSAENHEQEDISREKEAFMQMHVAEDDPDHTFWSLVADATHDHPLGKRFHGADEKEESILEFTPRPRSSDDESGRRGWRQSRRNQVRDKFVEDSTSAVLQEEGVPGGLVNGVVSDGDVVGSHENYESYNVTAEVVLSMPRNEDENDSTLIGGGSVSGVVTSRTKSPSNSTSTSNWTYQPLRIRAVLSEQREGGEFLTVEGLQVLLGGIIKPALLTWSAALRVEPVVGNLTVDKHQLFDNETCGPGMDSGLPSPKVPPRHLTEGIPDTDMVLYLSIGFAPGALVNASQFIRNSTVFDAEPHESTEAPKNATDPNVETAPPNEAGHNRDLAWDSQEENYLRVSSATATPSLSATFVPEDDGNTEASGAPNPTVNPDHITSQPLVCAGDYVAAASYCSTDQFDRPTAAMLHICIDETFFSNATRNKHIVTIMHEVGHALGFNARSMAHFRRQDGSPITPRVNGEIVETHVECTGPSSNRRSAQVALPSQEILQFRTVRGGLRVAEIVTPSVLQVVRNHFDCQNLSGAELESGEYSPISGDPEEEACIGDHWERRLFQNDLMNPVVDGVEYSPFVSTITLAYFADSGWYQVDLSMAELAGSWGRGAGCGFVENTCICEDGTVPLNNRPFFCNAVPKTTSKGLVHGIDGCTADLYRKAACSLGQYDTELPPEFQYFGLLYDGTVGGSDPYLDYCPTYAGFDNGLCSSLENAALLKVNNIERFGERNSRCLSGLVDARATALCLPIACVVEDRSLHVKVDGTWRLCGYKDQELKVFENQYVVCPDPRRVCPTFYCHHDCLGTSGRCDYDTGACVCNGPNATGTTLGLFDDNLTSATGFCKRKQDLTAVGGRRNRTLSEMPHELSPLSDYYVAFKESLRDDQMRLLTTLQLIILVLFMLIIAAALFWYFQLRDAQKGDGCDNTGNDTPFAAVVNPNKHKMIATVLVDMRINTSDGASVAPTADTASSVCEMESSASIHSAPCAAPVENDDKSSMASDEVPDDTNVLATNLKCSVRKRRYRRGLKSGRD